MIYNCLICKKEYSSYKSLWNHNKIFHKNDVVPNVAFIPPIEQNVVQNVVLPELPIVDINNNSICKYCNKKLCDRKYRWKHEKKCKEKTKKKEDELKITVDELVTEKIDKILKTMKIHPKTLQKINNQLINNNNSNNTVNNVINVIVPNIDHNLKEIFTKSEKMEVLTAGNEAHLKLTDILYKKPKYEKYRNVYITNLSNDIGYIYDKKENRFIVKSKKDILDDYGVERFSDIQYFYEELETRLDGIKLDKLKDMVKNYFNDKTFQDLKNKEMLISLYNNKVNVKKIYEIVNKEVKEIEL